MADTFNIYIREGVQPPIVWTDSKFKTGYVLVTGTLNTIDAASPIDRAEVRYMSLNGYGKALERKEGGIKIIKSSRNT